MDASNNSLARQKQILAHFREAIADLGYDCRLFSAGEVMEFPVLLVGIEKDDQGRDRTVNLMLLPFVEAESFHHLNLIQFYAPLPFQVSDGQRDVVEKKLLAINNRTTLGYFGLTDAGAIFLRYVWSIDKVARPTPERIQQLFLLFNHQQDTFARDLEAVL